LTMSGLLIFKLITINFYVSLLSGIFQKFKPREEQ
jgi:hypothetical protein